MTTIAKVNPPPPSTYSGANGRSPERRGANGGAFYEGEGAAGKPRMPFENQMGSPSGNPANSTEGKGEGAARGEVNGTNRGTTPGAGGASNKGVSG